MEHVELEEVESIGVILNDLHLPDNFELDVLVSDTPAKDLFAEHQRKAWDKTTEARCDFKPYLRMTRRSGLFFSLFGKNMFMAEHSPTSKAMTI